MSAVWHQKIPPGLPVFWGSQSCDPAAWLAERQLLAGDIESNPGPKPTLKTLLHTLIQSPTLTKFNNSPVQPSQSCPPSLFPARSSVQSPLPPLQNTPTYHRASIQLHTLIYLKQHTGPLDVSREGGASAGQVERTPGRAALTYWVVGPLHNYTQEGWVDNNNNHIPNITTQHGFKTKHSTNTALHNINNTVATDFSQPIPPTRTIVVALDMSKVFFD